VLAPARICQILTVPSDNCITQKRPNSSDHGAQSSQPIPYKIKNHAMPALAFVKWLSPRLYSLLRGPIALEYTAAL
jgi:hypothetical protein